MADYKRNEAKDWARKNYRGLESCIYPSFTPDMKDLDEEGIRHDVRLEIAQGFFSILLCPGAAGLTMEERFRFTEIVNDEAKGKILTSAYVEHDVFEDGLAIMEHHARTGGTKLLMGFPQNYYPESEEDAYRVLEKLCNATDLAVDIYPTSKFNLGRFHMTGFPPAIMEKLAKLPNVTGMKIGHGPIQIPSYTEECYRLCGDEILVCQPDMTWWEASTQKYGSMWTGSCPWHALQTPDDPRGVQCYEYFLQGDLEKAMPLYWQLLPIWMQFGATMPQANGGIYHYTLWKYTQWLVGGNGGLMRMPAHRLYDKEAATMKKVMKACGVKVREAPFEEFLIGRLNYEKGMRTRI
ncbi:hypothetical protein BH10PSE12_BH10PSE12_22500 [soil metagenome]